MDFIQHAVSIELVKLAGADGKAGTFRGYGSVFNNRDLQGDMILPGAFAKSLGRTMPMMYNHFEGTIGKIKAVEEDEKGLVVEGEFTPGNTLASDVHALLKHGAVNGLSIRGTLKREDTAYDEATNTRTLKSIDLMEVSIVTFPANTKARVDGRTIKALEELPACESFKDVETVLREVAGLSPEMAKLAVSKFKPAFARDALREYEQQAALDTALAKFKNITRGA
jgi:HK97 family phage prohead protease